MSFQRLFLTVFSLFLLNGCANIQSPTGGPKDKRPPRLVSSAPTPNQTNFKSVSVELTFDEAIKLNTPQEEIIISPSPGKDVQFLVKKNRVIIIPMKPWRDSTTYSILFRDGIQDITEGNIPDNLKLAFSTGPFIDSLALSGNVTDLLLGTPQEKITVAIFESDTFDIFNHTPSYFTKTNKLGDFRLENIRAGSYRIYAFNDDNKNLKVESRSEMYGFLASKIALRRNVDTLSIGLISLDARPLKFSSIRNIGTVTRLRFSKNLADYQIRSPGELKHAFSSSQSEINIWNPDVPDSVLIEVSAMDSLENRADSSFYIKKTKVTPAPERFTWSLGTPTINPDNSKLQTILTFSKPLRTLNIDSILIQVDSTSRISFSKEDMTVNQQRREISLTKPLSTKFFGADQDPILTLVAKKGFAITMDEDTTRALSAGIRIYWPEENGTLSLQAVTKQKGYLIQVIDRTTGKVVAQAVNTPKLSAKNIPPADYRIRIIFDRNQNGRWDPGNIVKGVEPEKIIYYRGADGAVSFPIRANWEVGPLLLTF